ncbi:ANTAR domain-containing protein [Streptomyces actinomycinicus]|uniref:ANTAR domain-containing protein n=1 Tax=Streptomyces actinomycinicus TaxID=1695166 RepID=A0A937EGT4_9ACTN|nr:ANTAR domain-containing protein [Streptomyces actinomycinicus]MBL1082536.1 ANTAR domain-containing protein [Streptomyces actinomycinicus]
MAFFALSRQEPLTLLSATDLAAQSDRLQQENDQLQRAVSSHAVIDQAIGAVVVLGRLAPEEAWRALRDVSQRTNVKLRTVAEHVLAYAQGGPLPEPVRAELAKAIARYRRYRGTPAALSDGLPAPDGGDGGDGSPGAAAPSGPRPGRARTARR